MRALAFLPIALFTGLGSLVMLASCDTGGEPPGGEDAGGDGAFGDTSVDSHMARDTRPVDTSSNDSLESNDGACGLSGNACCTGDAAPCGEHLTCKDKVCDPPCGDPGQKCCPAPGDACNSASSVCSKGYCTACGASGEACCALNVCESGGCCIGNTGGSSPGICSPEGTTCAGSDGGVCMAGGCGTCGSAGQPCCAAGCTAPETVCQGATEGVDAGEGGGGGSGTTGECAGCGGPGQPCCAGSGCQGSLTCTSSVCVCDSDSGTCPDGG